MQYFSFDGFDNYQRDYPFVGGKPWHIGAAGSTAWEKRLCATRYRVGSQGNVLEKRFYCS